MTDAIKKMLEPNLWSVVLGEIWLSGSQRAPDRRTVVDLEDFNRLKRGFEKLMEQNAKLVGMVSHYEDCFVFMGDDEDGIDCNCGTQKKIDTIAAELEKAMVSDGK